MQVIEAVIPDSGEDSDEFRARAGRFCGAEVLEFICLLLRWLGMTCMLGFGAGQRPQTTCSFGTADFEKDERRHLGIGDQVISV